MEDRKASVLTSVLIGVVYFFSAIIVVLYILAGIGVWAYEPPTDGAGSGKPSQTEGSGTRSSLKTIDDRASGR